MPERIMRTPTLGRHIQNRRRTMPWRKGHSGNPGGRPVGYGEIRQLARAHTTTALETLVEVAKNAKSESARVAAAVALLDRGWGRPTQPLAGDADEPPIGIEMSTEERRRRARQAIHEAFREWRPHEHETGWKGEDDGVLG